MLDELVKKIGEAVKKGLPGEEYQYKMAPLGRRSMDEYLQRDPKPRHGSVLILLYPHLEKIFTVLILRPEYDGNHSGQVGFPGGKPEAADENLTHTALREAQEEVGVDPASVTVICELTNLYIPVSNYRVHPFLAYSHKRPDFVLDEKEVQRIIEMPVDHILNDAIVKEKEIFFRSLNKKTTAPYFEIGNETVWGATAMILSEFREVLLRANESSGKKLF